MAIPPKPSVTIAIPAFNEGRTISKLVSALLYQAAPNFLLESVLINSDGSNDNTVPSCRALNSDKVHVIDNADRRGKAVRQTELFRLNQSDIHICFDADVMPAHGLVISALVDAFREDVGLVGGVVRAVPGKTLLERTYIKEREIWQEAVSAVNGGLNVYRHEGRISAVSRQFAAAIEIPSGISGTDDYIYILARKLGFKFGLAPDAVVLYRAPTTLSDWRKQRRRFLASSHVQANLFGREVQHEFEVPARHKLRAVAKAAMASPIMTTATALLWIYGRMDALVGGFTSSPVGWDVARTTKDLWRVKSTNS